MRKITLLFASLFLMMGSAWAQPEAGKMYRIKLATQDLYLTITGYNGEGSNNAHGAVPFLEKSVANPDQVWITEATDKEDVFYLKSKSGYYIEHGSWNVNACDNSTKGEVSFIANDNNTYLLKNINHGKWYKAGTANGGDATIYPYCDVPDDQKTTNAASFVLEAVEEAEFTSAVTVTYTFKCDGEVVATQKVTLTAGGEYPEFEVPFGYTATTTKPEGTVEADATKEVELEVSLPFEAADEVANITTWYYVKMHSNNPKYIKPVVIEKDGKTEHKIEWNDATVTEANKDAHLWAFVGNLKDGFIVVNKNGLAINSSIQMDEVAKAEKFKLAKTSETSENAKNGFCLKHSNGAYLNAQNPLATWGSTDAGSTIMLEEYVNTPTGIDAVEADAKTVIYDLTGRRVEKMEKGIYIINGKKVVIK